MYKIALVNMPYAALQQPSLALTQLKAITETELKDQVAADILYLNHDFAHYLGLDVAQMLAVSSEAHNACVGDWFFRQSAFPELADNTEAYFRRFFPVRSEQIDSLKEIVLEKRKGLDDFLDQLITKYALDQIDLIGFTSMFTQNLACFALAKRMKIHNPKVITVIGGANCESPMGQEIAKNVRQIDFVFAGPALKTFPQFIRHCLNNNVSQCHLIPGVYSRKNCSLTLLSETAVMGEELDIDIPIELDYSSFLETHEKNFANTDIKPNLLFETSRGCWWGEKAHCTFCGLNGQTMKYRSMQPEKALRQFDSLFQYAERIVHLEAVDNIVPRSYLKEVFPYLKTPPNLNLFYEVKADLSEEDVQTLANARIRFIQPGIEALATSTLKLMRKGTNAFQNLSLLKNCRAYDVFPAWNLLVGFPGEQEAVYRKYVTDLPLLVHLPPPSGAYPVRFDRYSPYFVKAKEYELDLHPLDYYEFIYPFDTGSLANLAYYFTDRNFGADYIKAVSKWISKLQAKVSQWQSRWRNEKGLPPMLYFKDKASSTVVYDSRSGKAIEHEVGATGIELLKFLNQPKRLNDISKEFGNIAGLDLPRLRASLQARGLIFQEGDRFFNLVMAKEPPPMSKLE